MFAFDFDGVICDSLEEGLLVSWNAHIHAPVRAFAEPGLAGVPPAVSERFARCRPFARHLGHWLVPLVLDSTPTSRSQFAARYDALADETVNRFTAAATAYRARVRHAYPDLWLAHHRIHPGISELVDGAYLVTARDRESVGQVLDAHVVRVDRSKIFGSCVAKPEALKAIAVREAVDRAAVTLIDDSVENCVAARAAGYSAWWARWGYGGVADEALASARGITSVSVDGLRQRVGEQAR